MLAIFDSRVPDLPEVPSGSCHHSSSAALRILHDPARHMRLERPSALHLDLVLPLSIGACSRSLCARPCPTAACRATICKHFVANRALNCAADLILQPFSPPVLCTLPAPIELAPSIGQCSRLTEAQSPKIHKDQDARRLILAQMDLPCCAWPSHDPVTTITAPSSITTIAIRMHGRLNSKNRCVTGSRPSSTSKHTYLCPNQNCASDPKFQPVRNRNGRVTSLTAPMH